MEKGSGGNSCPCKTAFLREVHLAHATLGTSKHFRNTVLKCGNFGEQNSPYPSRCPSFKNGVFSASNSNSGSTLHGGVEVGKFHVSLIRSAKRQKGRLGQDISPNFVADCRSVLR